MELTFTKMEGIGNDFILLDDRDLAIEQAIPYPELAKKLCSRHFGIGADGIILTLPSTTHDIRYRIFNSDGSEAGMCGNGMRCFAKFLFEKSILTTTTMRVQTESGTIIPELRLSPSGDIETICVDMGEPVLDPLQIPFKGTGTDAVDTTILVNGTPVRLTALFVGNPHAVVFVDDVAAIDLRGQGRAIETCDAFPLKTNVEFIQVLNDRELRMRVWERGAGETLACGTGACASLVAAHLTGRTGPEALIHLAGGDLFIQWDRSLNRLYKTGPATLVFEGSISI